MNTNGQQRAAIYLRVSTDDQATDGYGLDVQRVRCEAMLQVKGMTLADVYTDAGVSGTLIPADRPEMARMMQDAARGAFTAVIVLALDRLGRRVKIILDAVEELTAAGVDVVSCKESLDTSTPTGRFVLTMFAALAELERDTIIQRTTDGRNARGRVDGERGGRLPYGYVRIAGDGISIDPARAETVREIFTMREKAYTLRDIARALNVDGLTTARGKAWDGKTVRDVLLNAPAYHGGKRGESDVRWPVILERQYTEPIIGDGRYAVRSERQKAREACNL